MGRQDSASRIASGAEHLRDAVRHASDYYKQRATPSTGSSALKLAGHYVRFLVWGYGFNVSRLMLSATTLLLLLSTFASRDTFTFNVAAENQVRGLSWAESFYLNDQFTTVGFGDITPVNTAARAASMTALCGVVPLDSSQLRSIGVWQGEERRCCEFRGWKAVILFGSVARGDGDVHSGSRRLRDCR
jgi:hypothetical protein